MKRLRWIILAVLISLVAAGVAVVHEIDGPNTAKFSATFKGDQTRYSEKGCAHADGYQKTHAVYWGSTEWQVGDRTGVGRARVKLRTHGEKDGLTSVWGNMRTYNGDGHKYVGLRIGAISEDGGKTAVGRIHEYGHVLATARIDMNEKTATIQLGSGEMFALGIAKHGRCHGIRPHDEKTDKVKQRDHESDEVKPKIEEDKPTDESEKSEEKDL